MTHRTTSRFRAAYNELPERTRKHADRAFELLKKNPRHPSLRFKQVGKFYSARIGAGYRALAVPAEDAMVWVWIGTHDEYDRLTK